MLDTPGVLPPEPRSRPRQKGNVRVGPGTTQPAKPRGRAAVAAAAGTATGGRAAEGAASFVRHPRRERARGARGLHAARAPTPPARGYCSRRGLATLGPAPRAPSRPGFLTLGRRRTPAPLRAPAAPSPRGAPAPFKPASRPRAALPPRPAFLTGSCRRRRLPSAAPAPPRGAGGRVGVSPLLTKQRGRRRARVSLARAPAPLGRPPTPPAPPLRAHPPAPLPPPPAAPASAARPAACARAPTLPLPARLRGRKGLGGGGRGERGPARPTRLPTGSRTVLRLRPGVSGLRTPRVLTPPSMRRAGATAAAVGDWGMGLGGGGVCGERMAEGP